ncbi:uncharacterized protein I303_102367 [Kwoniella dejecticola CBS 10117]|uniref:Peptide hydrolase n=1 Tax=Kwoniella dejecticola CBS 10117 TaxID=1296121 RepID=A0A1A6AB41_9TREE|nr:uncharacterized protein I303_01493 [Kwoniella dejecticola CBS 10117]OBR87291.1 hypothetical protein I303_01493 [Kwoniella dejecticola CBS 10117]
MVRLSIIGSLLALPALSLIFASPLIESQISDQLPLNNLLSATVSKQHEVHSSILSALERYDDPVDALLSLKPELEGMMAERRLIRVFGEGPSEGIWMTEGDKLRLRRDGKKFMDLTESQELLESSLIAEKANTPEIVHQRYIKPIFADLKTSHMHDVLVKATSFFNRYYYAETGVQSARWLHDHIASIIAQSPVGEFISLEFHTHRFPQPSIIARFEPPTRNASLPLTIIGAHQDSANYLFPLLPAPGADDDMSGSTSILEAFRALALRGFIPARGPVEFHWYAAEEAGLLGSQEIVAYKRGLNAKVGAMIEFDMTAFVARNTTPHIFLLENDADDNLTKWVVKLAQEYVDIPVNTSSLGAGAGSDYMSWTRGGYPAAFAAEGDPLAGGFPGDFDGYIHTDKDRMDVDDETGYFSLEHMLEFSKLAVAFAVEQAGWSDKHTRGDDNKKSVW